jgi:hypothetical protein
MRFSWWWLWRMLSSGMWCHVALVRTDISEEHTASIIRVRRISELGVLAVTSNWTQKSLVTVSIVPSLLILFTVMELIHSSETLVLTRATQCHITEGILLKRFCLLHFLVIPWIEFLCFTIMLSCFIGWFLYFTVIGCILCSFSIHIFWNWYLLVWSSPLFHILFHGFWC